MASKKQVLAVPAAPVLSTDRGASDLAMILDGTRKIDDQVVRYYLAMLIDRVADLVAGKRLPSRRRSRAPARASRASAGIRTRQ